jgi:phosphoglycerate dehydrogenase-like enzyme
VAGGARVFGRCAPLQPDEGIAFFFEVVMSKLAEPVEVAVLDDYQGVALEMANWSSIEGRARITVFRDHLADQSALVRRLEKFNVVCVMRERTPLPREVIERLPRLQLIVSTGPQNRSIDAVAAGELGISIVGTGYFSESTVEQIWALIFAIVRDVASEAASVKSGGWQRSVGRDLAGRVLGVLGLGNIGSRVATIGKAIGMRVIAWSENLTAERAASVGAELVSKEELFRQSDILSINTILSHRTKGLIGRSELALMKPDAWLVNTSRGPIVDENALVDCLRSRRIGGAALDVFDVEPLPADHPFRSLDNVIATPHVGYVSRNLYRTFYGDTVKAIANWLDGQNRSAKA